uniref:Uncharacterized protein n=1 Tax=Solanum tuberosum TaxID=4113 RepID=M1DU22_SOLTU
MLVALSSTIMLMKMKYSMGMEAKHRVDTASRPPLFGVGPYDIGFHGLLSWSMSVNAYYHHVRCALWLLEKFYEVWVVVWDSIHALHE